MKQQQQQRGTSYPSGDFWDVRDQSYAGQQGQPDHAFSELVEVKYTQNGGKNVVVALFAILLLAVGGYAGYEYFVNERDPVEAIMSYFNGESTDPDVETTVEQMPKRNEPRPAPVEVAKVEPESNAVLGNPYWELPNRILGQKKQPSRIWSNDEEDAFRKGLTHQFTYQQFKTVMDVRNLRLAGSDAILWEALQNKKFWTRIWAAIGLAEFDTEVGLDTLEDVVKNARSELIATFLERLERNPNAGQAFIARQLVKILDERGRLSALKIINKSNDKLREVYLVAATADPGRRVQKWIRRVLGKRPINPDKYNELMKVVQGTVDGTYIATGGKGEKHPVPEKPQEVMATGNEEDEDFTGEIEFFEEDMTETEPAEEAVETSY